MARYILLALMIGGLLTSCSFKRKKYDNPISKDTKQPDKVLYDRAINDIEHARYEVARITLNTLINTYDQSEFIPKPNLRSPTVGSEKAAHQGLRKRKPNTRTSSCSIPPWRRPVNRRKRSA